MQMMKMIMIDNKMKITRKQLDQSLTNLAKRNALIVKLKDEVITKKGKRTFKEVQKELIKCGYNTPTRQGLMWIYKQSKK